MTNATPQTWPAWQVVGDDVTTIHCTGCGATLMAIPHESTPFTTITKCRRHTMLADGNPVRLSEIAYEIVWHGKDEAPTVRAIRPEVDASWSTPYTAAHVHALDNLEGDELRETARQLVAGARLERDQARGAFEELQHSNRMLSKQYVRENDLVKQANGRIMRLERELESLQMRTDAIDGAPEPDKTPTATDEDESPDGGVNDG